MFRILMKTFVSFTLLYVILRFGALPFFASFGTQETKPVLHHLTPQESAEFSIFLRKQGELTRSVSREDEAGHFQTAVAAALQCVALPKTLTLSVRPSVYCLLYYERALKSGRGIEQDQEASFKLLEPVGRADVGDYALDLAEDYLDGSGVPSNYVEAATLVWRVNHGNLFSLTWRVMCEECGGLWRQASKLTNRLDHGISSKEQREATKLERLRYPQLFSQVQREHAVYDMTLACALVLFVIQVWRRRKPTPTQPSHLAGFA